jgi:O-succinylbenzoic acid--CoA ligase
LNGDNASDWYTPFDQVHIRLSEEGTLVIHAPEVCAEELTTNDIAEINEKGKFRILGRKDNVINSGGIKIQIEQVEALLKPHLSTPFVITSTSDAKFGEAVVLLYEKGNEEELQALCKAALPPYWIPKRFVQVEAIPLTETGKPNRPAARFLAR